MAEVEALERKVRQVTQLERKVAFMWIWPVLSSLLQATQTVLPLQMDEASIQYASELEQCLDQWIARHDCLVAILNSMPESSHRQALQKVQNCEDLVVSLFKLDVGCHYVGSSDCVASA